MIRLKREQYAVGEAEHGGVDVTVGLYYDVPAVDDIDDLTRSAQRFAELALEYWGGNHAAVSEAVQRLIDGEFPDRPFYVETREKGRGVQVYQPYGMPQDTIVVAPDKPPVHPGARLPDHES